MANKAVNSLDIETPLGSDYLLGIGASKEYRALVADVAEYIIENYTGSTLAGTAQSIQAAVNAEHNRFRNVSSGSIFDITEPGLYYLTATVTGKPTVASGSSRGALIVLAYTYSSTNYIQYIFVQGITEGGEIHKCLVYNGTQSPWERIWPSDKAWNFALGTDIPANSDLNDYLTIGNYVCINSTRAATLTNPPVSNAGFLLKVFFGVSASAMFQMAITNAETPKVYIRRAAYSSNAWSFSSWVQLI